MVTTMAEVINETIIAIVILVVGAIMGQIAMVGRYLVLVWAHCSTVAETEPLKVFL